MTDNAGASIQGVVVTAKNVQTGVETKSVSADNGFYTITALIPGPYEIAVSKPGFRAIARSNVQLNVAQIARIDFTMEVGNVQETVSVTDAAPLLEVDNPEVGTVIDNKQILDLPLNGRNPYQLTELAPGVAPQGGFYTPRAFGEQTFQSNFKINGGVSLSNEIMINGTTNVVAGQGNLAYTPPVDAVQEFKVLTTNFSAEYGRTGGGVVNLVTKSGTNKLHGSAYEFHRNDELDANNFFNNRSSVRKQPFVYNNFGFSAGGPVFLPRFGEGGRAWSDGRNKTFWFFAYEGLRVRQSFTVLARVPTALEKAGDFSQTRDRTGAPVVIYNPYTSRQVGGVWTRDPFPGNRIPANLLDPVALKVASFYAEPNLAFDPSGVNNFIANPRAANDFATTLARVDHSFSPNNKFFVEYGWDKAVNSGGNAFGNIASNGTGQVSSSPDQHVSIQDTHTFGPRTLLTLRYGFARNAVDRSPNSVGMDLTTLGFPAGFNNALRERRFPLFLITGYSTVGNGAFARYTLGSDVHSINGSLMRIIGNHTLTFGFDGRAYRYNSFTGWITSGQLSFGPNFTQGPNALVSSATAGSGFASFLLGTGSGFIGVLPPISYNVYHYAPFVQDNFRLTRRLMLNIGLRYGYESPRKERFNRQSFFDPAIPNPVGQQAGIPDLKGALRFAGADGAPEGWSRPDRNNFAPRFGFAWNVTPKTVVRGGYGITFLPNQASRNCCGAGQDGFSAFTQFFSSTNGVQPNANFLRDPFPTGLVNPPGSSLGLRTFLGGNFVGHIWDERVPYSQYYNLNVQRQLPGNFLVEAYYVGTRGVALPLTLQANQLDPKYLSQGTALLEQVPNPFFGVIQTGVYSQRTIQRSRLLRPYPQFDGITNPWFQVGSSTYHGFAARVEKRLSNELFLMASFTGAKLISNTYSDKDFTGDVQAPIQNNYDLRGERSLDPQDISRIFNLNAIYHLPFGKGRRWLKSAPGAVQQALGGWRVTGIYRYLSGTPLAVRLNVNNTNSFNGAARPHLVGDANLPDSERGINRWFNTGAFVIPPPFTFGTAPRTLPNARGPSLTQLDFSTLKNFDLTERMRLEFRAEFFNFTNHPVFGNPGIFMGTPQFGVISNQRNIPRQIQFGLKLYW